jgi:hypothetical protein
LISNQRIERERFSFTIDNNKDTFSKGKIEERRDRRTH